MLTIAQPVPVSTPGSGRSRKVSLVFTDAPHMLTVHSAAPTYHLAPIATHPLRRLRVAVSVISVSAQYMSNIC